MSTFAELQRLLLKTIEASTLAGESLDRVSLLALLGPCSPGLVDKALYGLRSRGLVEFGEFLGEDGVRDIELTAHGLDYVERARAAVAEPADSPQHIVVHGGNVQIGNNNKQKIRRS